ncbi:TonB-dependent receptor plug domain-containing protein [Pelagicoccus enzymogenes]|uniref:TonB-dependent receptor plug domain-containing protein n=1 Tax=Pelagicoccus enzymogenes TaxID=2773457 RepID=UPI0028100976|nr:TonB-dependent receptor plug domain-containing protein [Pelagicoccus enzymogenes]MDQ8198741.1 TonB-dependent receptor plug domain-containing protein [Pelagicoccus enzymogenes]
MNRYPNLIAPVHQAPWSKLFSISCIATISAIPLTAQNADEADEDVFELSPFEVTGEDNQGYRATSSLAGSRLKTQLKDVASAISVVTEEFLDDTASTDLKDILVYTTNSEVAGIGGNFYGTNADDGGYRNEMLVNPQRGTRLRGLNQADITRNYFTSNIPTNSYNISRVDIQRGSNSILYGLGSPAGIINGSLKDPYMSESGGALEVGFDSYGSHREVVDVSKPLIEDVLAVRFIAMNDESKFRQDHTFNDDRRYYGALRWQPKMGDGVFTQFDVRGEFGEIDANRPVSTTAADFASNWWRAEQLFMHEPLRANGAPQEPTGDPENPFTTRDDLRTFFTGAPSGSWWNGQPATIFQDPNSSVVGNGQLDAYRQRDGSPWGGLSGLGGRNWANDKDQVSYYSGNSYVSSLISNFESSTGQSFTGFGSLWPTQMILDGPLAMIDQSIQGPNKSEYNDFDSLELSFSQTYLDGNLGINVGYYDESYRYGRMNFIDTNAVTIDVNANLRAGYSNPDAGRPVVYGGNSASDAEDSVESLRATAFYKFDPGEATGNDLLGKLFGEQTFTAVFSDEEKTNSGANYNPFVWDAETYNDRYNNSLTYGGTWSARYLGDDLSGYSSFGSVPASAIQGLNVVQEPGSSNNVLTFDYADSRTWVTGTSNILDYRGDKAPLYNWAWEGYDTTESLAFVWQGRLLNDAIIPLFGWREDEYKRWDKAAPPRDETYNYYLPFDPEWTYEGVDPIVAKASRTSWGVVVHANQLLDLFGAELPGDTEFSVFYNDSSSFRPADVGIDNYGNDLASPSGTTEDYGFRLALFKNKLELRTTWYETTQRNTTLSDPSGMVFWAKGGIVRHVDGLAMETWGSSVNAGRLHQPVPEWLVNDWFLGEGAYDASVMNQPIPADWRDQISTLVNQPLRIRQGAVPGSDNYIAQGDINPETDQPYLGPLLTPEEVEYRQAWFDARTDAEWFRPLDPEWVASKDFQKITNDYYLWEQSPPGGQKLTNDLVSKGIEFEITANPTDRWRMSFNASKNEATRTNILPDWPRFIESMAPIWFDGFNSTQEEVDGLNYWTIDGYADVRHWYGEQGYSGYGETTGGRMMNQVYSSYHNLMAGEGQGVNELRKWRFNFVTNYQFADDGPMKGFNVGGAVRWQDKSAIGYYPEFNEDANIWVTDVDRPIYGPSEENYDAWVGYQRKLNDKVDYRVQLNVRNLFADDDMIPILANPDGSIAQVRIPAKTTWTLSNTFSF